MGKANGQGKRRSVTQGCCGIPLFPRISSLIHKPSSSGGSSGSAKSQAEEDPSSGEPAALDITKGNLACRRLRSDSPHEDGALEAQPLKRQNSMGEVKSPHVAATGAQSQSASLTSSRNTTTVVCEEAAAQAGLGKSQSFPPSKADEARNRRLHDAPVTNECPPYGSKSVIGRRAKMEDACVAVPYLLEVPLHKEADELLPPRLAPQLRSSSGSSRSSDVGTTTANHPISSGGVSNSVGKRHHSHDPVTTYKAGDSNSGQAGPSVPSLTVSTSEADSSLETLHFFGVFDGHGGADAAMHCAKTLHERLKEVLSAITSPTGDNGADAGGAEEADAGVEASTSAGEGGTTPASSQLPERTEAEPGASSAPKGADIISVSSDSDFLDAVDIADAVDMDEEVQVSDVLGPAASVEGVPCTTETVEAALTKAFHLTDEEFGEMGGYEHLALVGTTAVVALVGRRMIYVANCGDSRAVLSRDGQAVALTDDHKAAREDETARVEAAGGQILFWNGVRVMGLLAVSRAIGDHSLRPYVIAEPEVTIVNRHSADEILIMASDGLWDVMSNQEACNLAKKCLLRAQQRGSSRQSAARVAATVLTRAAVDRGSRDNVTVVIVDLTSSSDDAEVRRLGSNASLGHVSAHGVNLSSGSGSEEPHVPVPAPASIPVSQMTPHQRLQQYQDNRRIIHGQARFDDDEPQAQPQSQSKAGPAGAPVPSPFETQPIARTEYMRGTYLPSPFDD